MKNDTCLNAAEVKKAIAFRHPRRIPCWYSALGVETRRKYQQQIEALGERYPDDFLFVEYDAPDWGTIFVQVENGVGGHVVDPPLKDWADYPAYLLNHFPRRESERFARIADQRRGDERYVVGQLWLGLFERMCLIRGMQELMTDLYLHPAESADLADRMLDYFCWVAEQYAAAGVDGIIYSDDWGSQTSMLVAPEMFREFFKPRYARLIDHVHGLGLHFILHCCGNILPILPDLIDVKVDVLHPIQPGTMEIDEVLKIIGGRICVLGAVDVQKMLVEGTPETIGQTIENVTRQYWRPEGGFMLAPANFVTPEIPIENIAAMFEGMCRASTFKG